MGRDRKVALKAHAQSRFDHASRLGRQVLDDGRVRPLPVVEPRIPNLEDARAGVRAVGEKFLAHRGTGGVVGQ